MTLSCRLDTLWVSITGLAPLIDDIHRIKTQLQVLSMSSTADKNTVDKTKKQPLIDHRQITELTDLLLGQMRLAVRYAEIGSLHEEINDSVLFDESVERFIGFSKDASKTLNKLRKARRGE